MIYIKYGTKGLASSLYILLNQSDQKISTSNGSLIDQRKAERFPVTLPCKVEHSLLGSREALVTNISEGGLQLDCDGELVHLMMPASARLNQNLPVSLSIEILLPKQKNPINISVGIAYVRRIQKDSFLLGCQFQKFSPGSNSTLMAFLNALKPLQGN
jgi:hypothetical protein